MSLSSNRSYVAPRIRVLEFNATPVVPYWLGDHRKPRRHLAKDPTPLTVPPAICHQEDDLFQEGL